MKTSAFAAALGAAVAAAPAAADEVPFAWSGFYAGAFAGLGGSSADWNGVDGSEGLADYAVGETLDEGVATAGGYVGFNIQQGNIVWGAEADFSWFDSVETRRVFDPLLNEGLEFRSETKAIGSVRVRLGYAVDRTLLFVTGGLCYSRSRHVWDDDDEGGFGFNDAPPFEMRTDFGWVAGGGLEYAVGSNLTIRGEGLYYRLGSESGSFEESFSAEDSFKVQPAITVARIGASYRF